MTDTWTPGPPPPPPAPIPPGLQLSDTWNPATGCAPSGVNSIVDNITLTGSPTAGIYSAAWATIFNDGQSPPNFLISHYNGSGNLIDSPMAISGVDGTVTFNDDVILSEDPVEPMQAATKHYVDTSVGADLSAYLPLAGGTMTGVLTLAADPTANLQPATKHYVDASLAAGGVLSFNTRTGAVTLSSGDVTGALGFTPYNTTNPAGYQTAAQVTASLAPYALTSSVPIASSTAPVMDGTAAVGVGTTWARGDHVHPTDTSRYAASNPAGYQTAAQVTASLGAYLPLAGGTLTGALNVNVATAVNSVVITPTAAIGANLVLNKAAGQASNVWGMQATLPRWQMALGNGTAEGTGNVGSDFQVNSFDNTGAGLGVPLVITRATGQATFGNGQIVIQSSGAASFTGAVGAGAANLVLNKNGAFGAQVFGANNNSTRWSVQFGNATAEGGSNSGSDFQISSYSDTGVGLGAPLSINRATGQATFAGTAAGPNLGVININGPVGNRTIVGQTSGSARWRLTLGDGTGEGGSNSGSNFSLQSYTDTGGALANPISTTRSTGVTTFSAPIVNGPSDRTLKENIAPLEDALDKVNALQGVSFNMIATPEKREIGLIAQDVEPIVPEIIQTYAHFEQHKAAGDKLALDYPKLVALLIEAVKTLTARIEVLEAGSA